MDTAIYLLPIEQIKGVTKANVSKFKEKLRINNLGELVMHLPRNYEDRSRIYTLPEVKPGNKVTVRVKVLGKYKKVVGRYDLRLVVNAVDPTGETITITFYRAAKYYDEKIVEGGTYTLFGAVDVNRFGQSAFQMHHPEIITEQNIDADCALTPIYPSTDRLKQETIRKAVNDALNILEEQHLDNLIPQRGYPLIPFNRTPGSPTEYININNLDFTECLKFIHNPPAHISVEDLINRSDPHLLRLIAEEILAKQLSLIRSREVLKSYQSIAIKPELNLAQKVIDDLPYKLTNAQMRAFTDIVNDLATGHPMLRLVQGDVGCGKTMVALLAIAHLAEKGYQVAMVAPTEILALQLFENINNALSPYGIETVFVSSRLNTKGRREANELVSSGKAKVIVGTHAVYSDWLNYHNLGMVIIDEQHRFGVEQRLEISKKQPNFKIHTLMMSATPAPRSIAMTMYADLDLSIIDELPPGRTPVDTFLLSTNKRDKLISRIRHVIHYEKRQVYWVCVLIEENENYNAHSAQEALALLQEQMPEVKIGLIHGRLKDQEKESIMMAFKNKELDMIVATTVIEVGVNVPNASIMVIENPERLGLSQIHQLRGRVGRGSVESFCCLLHDPGISQSTKERLSIFTKTNDGFVIAEEDMKLRGIGDMVGTKQSGEVEFVLSNLAKDYNMAQTLIEFAENLYTSEPELSSRIINRWLPNQKDYILA
ncbi:hypothetical protein CJP74_04390 [Psittacicella melopsittaci]|uniref:Probable DNA 3'-5' helicase RecG n=1 Tax=Psittacicella melopsittaci TaxID=2028576 RepID=A0A3A1Y4M8_9GAMM|nr:ATP-dependent DNA helicase RecG [Psittacicella melopsittaci]RIY32525.1 hypothetical protein CJP74_04390 [Psittacicella melopsittaci]